MVITLLISILLIVIGIWLFYVNYVYAGVEPILQNGFICTAGGLLLFCGIWGNNFDVTLSAPAAIILPLALLAAYTILWHARPRYTYEAAKKIVATMTHDEIIPRKLTICNDNGMYAFYTERRHYFVDPQTGDVYEQYALFTAEDDIL